MAEEQKPVEVAPVTAAPVVEPVAAETKPVEETPAVAAVPETTDVAAPAATEPETKPAEETATDAAAAPGAAAPAEEDKKEEKKEEVKPVEEGALDHKGTNFPKNLIYSKKLFWFGSEPVDTKAIPTFKADKAVDVAHHITAWAAETGKGLLFHGEKDKSSPSGAILLSEAAEPVAEGTNKFHVTAKGHKHTFKAANAAERDNWVAQLKLKIAEAKELATTVTESETYKKTLESLKPAPPVKKEEKKEEAKTEEPAAETPAAAAPATEEAVTDAAAVTEPAKTEEVKAAEKTKKERRSASRKRQSVFGSMFGKKEEKKAAEPAAEVKPTEGEALAAETAAAADAPLTEAVVEPTPIVDGAAEAKPEESKPEEEKKEAKPAPVKRQSLFGGLSFGKKKAVEPEASKEPATEAVAETAPVIPAVETSEPLSTEAAAVPVAAPAAAETTEAAPATNGETKKEMKSDKRKSSLPFGFAKKEKAATSDEEGEKAKSPSPFSKFRATIKGKGKAEKTDKAEKEETPAVPAVEGEAAKEAEKTEAAPVEPEVAAAPAVEEPVAPKPVESTPAVTAAA